MRRSPAEAIHPDSDLGCRLVTRDVAPLSVAEIATALNRGVACAEHLVERGLILGAALQLQGTVRTVDHPARSLLPPVTCHLEIARHA